MTLSSDDFRRQIFWSATESVSLSISRLLNLTQAKISKLKVSFMVKQNIFWFQVAVYYPVGVQMA